MLKTPYTTDQNRIYAHTTAVMVSVSMDLFKLPPVEWEGVVYDTFIVCADWHSVWLVAISEVGKGFTGKNVPAPWFVNSVSNSGSPQ